MNLVIVMLWIIGVLVEYGVEGIACDQEINLHKAWSDEATTSHLLMFRIETQEKNVCKYYQKLEKNSRKTVSILDCYWKLSILFKNNSFDISFSKSKLKKY